MNALPINEVLPELVNTLRKETNAVLVAAPGAGKTTRVPLALRDEAWLHNRRIVMLVPRRLAARQAAPTWLPCWGKKLDKRSDTGLSVNQESVQALGLK